MAAYDLPTTATYLLPITFPEPIARGYTLWCDLGQCLIDPLFCHRLSFVNYKDFNCSTVALHDVSLPYQAYNELLRVKESTNCHVECTTAEIPLMHVKVLLQL